MSLRTSFLKPSFTSMSLVAMSVLSSQVFAETALNKAYKEPTRGFFIEHGMVAGSGNASVELHTGSDEFDSGGGIRLGLPNAELILNSGFDIYDTNELLVKYALPRQNSDGTQTTPLQWAVLAGVSHTNIDEEDEPVNTEREYTSLKAGLAISVKADAGLFTATPKLVYSREQFKTAGTSSKDNDTFFELDLGAYVGLIDTRAGLFSAGVEAVFTSEEDTDNTYAFGMRWSYDERLNLDIIPVVLGDDDITGIPGVVRLNVNF